MYVTAGFMWDRAMSMHRRAYEIMARGGTCDEDWWPLARRLEIPVDAIDQVWKVAKAAFDAGMAMKLAFPLIGEYAHDPVIQEQMVAKARHIYDQTRVETRESRIAGDG